MPSKGTGVQLPDLKYSGAVQKQRVPVGEFSANWLVRVLPVKLLRFHLHEYPNAFEAIRKWRPKNDKENVQVNRLSVWGLRQEIPVLLYVFSSVPASGYTLFCFYLMMPYI